MPKTLTREIITKGLFLFRIHLAAGQQRHGGSLRFISQHSLLWGGQNSRPFTKDLWKGVCAGLSVEWMKAEADGSDFVKRVIDMRNTILIKSGDDAFASFAIAVKNSHLRQGSPDKGLVPPFRLEGEAVTSPYPFTTLASQLRKDLYAYISTGTHALAAKMGSRDVDNTVTFYDPNVGELRDTKIACLVEYLAAFVKDAADLLDEDEAKKQLTVQHFTR